jgi:hypothetical protein
MTFEMKAVTESAEGRSVEFHTVTADQVDAKREELRQSAPHGSTRTITVK